MKKLKSIFIDQYVTIILKSVTMTQVNPETGEQLQGNVVVNGIFIDTDERFVYLGLNELEITDAVPIDEIARISTVTEEEALAFDITSAPTEEGEWN